jgi:uncharacterized protein (DUF697 family)
MNKKNLPKAIRPADAFVTSGQSAPLKAAAEPATPLQSEPLQSKATMGNAEKPQSSAELRRAAAMKVVERFSLWSGAAGLIPLPLVDLATVSGVQIQMLRRISQIYDVPFSENLGKALIASLAGSMIPASSGIGAMSLIKGVPIAGSAVSALAMPALSAGAAYAIGVAFVEHFASGGTLLDFKPGDFREFMKARRRLHNT